MDLWEVRECFHDHFQRTPLFIFAQEDGQPLGLIPLSWIPESNCYGYFPGEVWQGKTWLEQNRVVARDQAVFNQMLNWLKRKKIPFHLRYLLPNSHLPAKLSTTDEIGYIFYSELMSYNIDNYYALFSRKSRKAISREVDKYYLRDLTIRLDEFSDFDVMVRMSIERFGEDSYFKDERFSASFRQLAEFLRKKRWLRITTVIIDGKPAAVDVGCLYKGVYTLLAGGTDANYPGVAKVINLHHIKKACEEKYKEADFLSGDFSWKKIFHLSPRPLDLLSNIS